MQAVRELHIAGPSPREKNTDDDVDGDGWQREQWGKSSLEVIAKL